MSASADKENVCNYNNSVLHQHTKQHDKCRNESVFNKRVPLKDLASTIGENYHSRNYGLSDYNKLKDSNGKIQYQEIYQQDEKEKKFYSKQQTNNHRNVAQHNMSIILKHVPEERNFGISTVKEICEHVNTLSLVKNKSLLNVPKLDESFTYHTPVNSYNLPDNHDIKVLHREHVKNLMKKRCKIRQTTQENYARVNLLPKLKNENLRTTPKKNNSPKIKTFVDEKNKTIQVYPTPGIVSYDNNENFVNHKVIYSLEYLNYIIKHLLYKEQNYFLSRNFLKNSQITDMNRSIVVDWLIKLQIYMRTEHVLIYTSVRIMDKAIDLLKIPLRKLQLVALASYWIAVKYHSVDQKNIIWIVNQAGGAYTCNDLANMERMVFKVNNYDVNAVEWSSFVHYYIFNLQLSNPNIISQCAHYLLDCALLNSRFARTLPSKMSAAAVYTSLHLMKQYDDKLWNDMNKYMGYYPNDELEGLKQNMIDVLKQVNDPSFPCRQPYYKYCSSRYGGVANIILDKLNNNNNNC